jgi:hypothetical protein
MNAEKIRELAEAMANNRVARHNLKPSREGVEHLVDSLVRDLTEAWPTVFPAEQPDPNAVVVRIAVGLSGDDEDFIVRTCAIDGADDEEDAIECAFHPEDTNRAWVEVPIPPVAKVPTILASAVEVPK